MEQVKSEGHDDEKPVLVIGAGSTGSSTAYHLAKRGRRVVLIDMGQVASGTTSKSTALVRTHYSNEIVARMALYSLKVFSDPHQAGEFGFVRNGVFFIAADADKDAIVANVAMLDRIGVKSETLDRSETNRRFPELDVSDCDYFLLEPESGYADPVGSANTYANMARQLGAQVLVGKNVIKLLHSKARLEGVELSDGLKISCSKAILCTNVWTNDLLQRSGVRESDLLPLWAVGHPVVTMRRPASYQGMRSTVVDLLRKTYYKPEGQSLLFAGSLDIELDKQRVEPDRCPSEIPFELLTFFSDAVSKRIPIMKEGEMHSNYIGMYDITPDQHPILDELSGLGLEGVYCSVGLSGHGFKLCPALGLMNADMLEEKRPEDSTFDWSCFRLSRFKEGKLLASRYSSLGTIA
jgi:glycine/D-amino acid oxidase-like deaminating enzyme